MTAELTPFWISFPMDSSFPMGFGVTAWSEEDAFQLLVEQGYDFHVKARSVDTKASIGIDDLDPHVRHNMGPVIVRGVWYPCLNIGFGASR